MLCADINGHDVVCYSQVLERAWEQAWRNVVESTARRDGSTLAALGVPSAPPPAIR